MSFRLNNDLRKSELDLHILQEKHGEPITGDLAGTSVLKQRIVTQSQAIRDLEVELERVDRDRREKEIEIERLRLQTDELEGLSDPERAEGGVFVMVASRLRQALQRSILYAEDTDTLEAEDTDSSAEVLERREALRRELAEVNELISRVVELGRLQSGEIRSARSNLDVGNVLRAAAERSERPDGVLLFVRPPSDRENILIDGRLLGSVLDELIRNALAATAPGGKVSVSAEIDRNADETRAAVRIHIEDSGAGLDPVLAVRINSLLSAEPQCTSGAAPGGGLGLFLVRERMRHLEGSAYFESVSGHGTMVTVEFSAERVLNEERSIS